LHRSLETVLPPTTWRGRLTDARMLDRADRRAEAALWSTRTEGGVVSTAHYRATAAGAELLDRGGNAIDAAIAASLALSVCEPNGSGLGGMALMLVHLAESGRTFGIIGPCPAPRRATIEAVLEGPRHGSHRAIAVPTYPAVIDHALARYGSRGPGEVVEPALRLARDGYAVTPLFADLVDEFRPKLERYGAARFFGAVPAAGGIFRQPVLADTLAHLARVGFRDAYEGEVAARIAAEMARGDAFLDAEDLAAYRGPEEVEPVSAPWQGGTAFSLGPPAGGRTLLQMLRIASGLALDDLDTATPEGAVRVARLIKQCRVDRRAGLAALDDPERAEAFARQLADPDDGDDGDDDDGETSHLSVVDRWGNMVAMTQSIERSFGSKVVAPDLGFIFNGYMKGFNVRRESHPHYLRPGAVARSNAAPTIVVRDGRARIGIGNTGSERMASGIFTALLHLARGRSAFEANHAPRLHATPWDKLLLEAERFDPAVHRALEGAGFELQPYGAYAFKVGGMHLVTADEDGSEGAADPRRDGAADGPEQ
jgi:gamma-glutamyltranspeptidase/glutathione hydrolase